MNRKYVVAASMAALLTGPAAVSAAVVSGFDATTLPPNDDASTGLVDLGFNANFWGVISSQVYVNNNGNVTLDGALETSTPFDLTSTGRTIIAPLFADVDTRNAGDPVTYGQGRFEGNDAFGVNWVDVDYFLSSDSHTNRNSFQLILAKRSDVSAGALDIIFNYDSIEWESGQSSGADEQGLGGESARAGYSNGSGDPATAMELLGSAVNGAFLDGGEFALAENSLNSDVPGRYIFAVRNNGATDPTQVPEPGMLTLLTLGLAGLWLVGVRYRHAQEN